MQAMRRSSMLAEKGYGASARPLRIMCNARWFEGRTVGGHPVDALPLAKGGVGSTVRDFVASWRADAVVFNIASRQLLLFTLLKTMLPFGRCRVVSVDLILNRPRSTRERVKVWLLRILFRSVDRFIFYFRDTDSLEAIYRIPSDRIRYVPFKVNNFADVLAANVVDEGFVLTCGRSKRDYATFASAMAPLGWPATILVPRADEAQLHGTDAQLKGLPPNVLVVHDDGTPASWLDWLRRASCVVLPIIPDTLAPSGVGTLLVAMALGKAVIITESPATGGILDERTAVLVPPRDVDALRGAIARVMEDAAFRAEIAEGGCAYARGLRDEARLADNIAGVVGELLGVAATDSTRTASR